MSRLRVVFMGSPEFAVPSLRAIAAAYDVVLLVAQPDKPAGRGQKLASPASVTVARELGLAVSQPHSARTPEFLAELTALAPDVAIVVAYGKILPQVVLDVPRLGCLNVHASVLPRYRGAAPINWAVIRGESETGVTIMQLDAGMDTGPTYVARSLAITDGDTAGVLGPRLADLGAALMSEVLPEIAAGRMLAAPQDNALATMAPMMEKTLGRIDWSRPAREVSCLMRGVDPWPGAFTSVAAPGGVEILKAWQPRLAPGQGAPGTVLGLDAAGLVVACGHGAIALGELQLPGKKRMAAAQLVAGRRLPAGTVLGG